MFALTLAALVAGSVSSYADPSGRPWDAPQANSTRRQQREINQFIDTLEPHASPSMQAALRSALNSLALRTSPPDLNDLVYTVDAGRLPRVIVRSGIRAADQIQFALESHRAGDVDAFRAHAVAALVVMIRAQLALGAATASEAEVRRVRVNTSKWAGTAMFSGVIATVSTMPSSEPRELLMAAGGLAALLTILRGPEVLAAVVPEYGLEGGRRGTLARAHRQLWCAIEHCLHEEPEWNEPLRVESRESYPWAPRWTEGRAIGQNVIRFLLDLDQHVSADICSDLLASVGRRQEP